jgi:renalase
MKTIIIGAGMTGLSAGLILQKQGLSTIILDKGRGLGGRMATRRLGEAKADHGAQYFSVKTPEFERFISGFEQKGIVKKWFVDGLAHPRYVGKQGMNAIAKSMAEGLDVRTSQKVIKVHFSENHWQVFTESQDVFEADYLLMTQPVPQVLELLENSQIEVSQEHSNILKSIIYEPCLAVMLVLKEPSKIPNGGQKLENSPIAWIADNQQKGISDSPSVTIHTTPKFAQENFDANLDSVAQQLIGEAENWLGEVESYQVHRWRYSLALSRYNEPFLKIASSLFVAGDAFGIGNVEGAFLSGQAVAQQIS